MVLGSGIRDPDSGSRGQKGTGSRIRIRNTASCRLPSTMSPVHLPPPPLPWVNKYRNTFHTVCNGGGGDGVMWRAYTRVQE
jgi:hypothetical protein